jgi:excisionase family DNA binding protein
MSTYVEITASTPKWQELMASRLAAGERALIRFEQPMMTPDELANSVGISRTAIMRRIRSGQIPADRKGNRYRIPLDVAQRFRDQYLDQAASLMGQDL